MMCIMIAFYARLMSIMSMLHAVYESVQFAKCAVQFRNRVCIV